MARLLVFTPNAWADYIYWQTQDKKTLKRINAIIEATAREPFTGIGKPEPLRGDLTGFWSRRIDDVNRLVYQATDTELKIYACRFHYGEH
jgi:toxin YoeB